MFDRTGRWTGPAAFVAALVLAVPAGAFASGDHGIPADGTPLERFRALRGEWSGTNSKGETVRLVYEEVGDGSAVLERLVIKGKEPHDMVTLYHMDGDQLMLTHYCVAGNQPRMRLTSASAAEARFDFVDATGLASPGAGHMHRAVIAFDGPDRLTNSWTWYEEGKEAFTEVIRVNRYRDRAAR